MLKKKNKKKMKTKIKRKQIIKIIIIIKLGHTEVKNPLIIDNDDNYNYQPPFGGDFGSDLDPLGGFGGGGLGGIGGGGGGIGGGGLMGPNHPMFGAQQNKRKPQRPFQVPPKAKWDPIGPGPDQGPKPDHFKPPNGDDHDFYY